MVRVHIHVVDLPLFVEKVILIPVLIFYAFVLALDPFIHWPFLDTKASFSIFFVTGIIFLAFWVHMILNERLKIIPLHKPLDTEDDVSHWLNKIIDDTQTELDTTHIFGFTNFTRDEVLECATRNESSKKRIRIVRIVGIQNEADRDIAKRTFEKKEALEHVEIQLRIIDLSKPQQQAAQTANVVKDNKESLLMETANVVIKDNNEALLIFPSRKEGKTKGIYIRDPDTVREVIQAYWLKIHKISTEATAQLIDDIKVN